MLTFRLSGGFYTECDSLSIKVFASLPYGDHDFVFFAMITGRSLQPRLIYFTRKIARLYSCRVHEHFFWIYIADVHLTRRN